MYWFQRLSGCKNWPKIDIFTAFAKGTIAFITILMMFFAHFALEMGNLSMVCWKITKSTLLKQSSNCKREMALWYISSLENLEPRQYKNDSIQSKIFPVLKLPHLFSRRVGDEKERQFQNWIFFDWMEFFLYCLSSSTAYQITTSTNEGFGLSDLQYTTWWE